MNNVYKVFLLVYQKTEFIFNLLILKGMLMLIHVVHVNDRYFDSFINLIQSSFDVSVSIK